MRAVIICGLIMVNGNPKHIVSFMENVWTAVMYPSHLSVDVNVERLLLLRQRAFLDASDNG